MQHSVSVPAFRDTFSPMASSFHGHASHDDLYRGTMRRKNRAQTAAGMSRRIQPLTLGSTAPVFSAVPFNVADDPVLSANLPQLIARVHREKPVVISSDERVEELEDEVRALKHDVHRLMKANEANKEGVQQVRKVNARLRWDMSRSKGDALTVAKVKAEMMRQAQQHKDRVAELEEQLGQANGTSRFNSEAADKLEQLEKEFNDQSDELERARAAALGAERAMETLKREVAEVKDTSANLATLLSDARQANKLLRGKLQASREAEEQVRFTLRQRDSKVTELQKEIMELKAAAAAKEKSAAQQVEEAGRRERDAQASKKVAEEEKEEEEKKVKELTRENTKMKQELAEANGRLEEVTKAEDSIMRKLKRNTYQLEDYISMENAERKAVTKARGLVAQMKRTHGISFDAGAKQLKVAEVTAGSPGEEGDVRKEDVVAEVNGVAMMSEAEWTATMETISPGDVVFLLVSRAGKPKTLKFQLGAEGYDATQTKALVTLAQREIRTQTQINLGGSAQYVDASIDHLVRDTTSSEVVEIKKDEAHVEHLATRGKGKENEDDNDNANANSEAAAGAAAATASEDGVPPS